MANAPRPVVVPAGSTVTAPRVRARSLPVPQVDLAFVLRVPAQSRAPCPTSELRPVNPPWAGVRAQRVDDGVLTDARSMRPARCARSPAAAERSSVTSSSASRSGGPPTSRSRSAESCLGASGGPPAELHAVGVGEAGEALDVALRVGEPAHAAVSEQQVASPWPGVRTLWMSMAVPLASAGRRTRVQMELRVAVRSIALPSARRKDCRAQDTASSRRTGCA